MLGSDATSAIIMDAKAMCTRIKLVTGTAQATDAGLLDFESMMEMSSGDVEAALKAWAAMSELGEQFGNVLADDA
jgi:hypothetical protein